MQRTYESNAKPQWHIIGLFIFVSILAASVSTFAADPCVGDIWERCQAPNRNCQSCDGGAPNPSVINPCFLAKYRGFEWYKCGDEYGQPAGLGVTGCEPLETVSCGRFTRCEMVPSTCNGPDSFICNPVEDDTWLSSITTTRYQSNHDACIIDGSSP